MVETTVGIKVVTQGGEEHEVETPLSIQTSDFIDELVVALKLPKKDADDHPIVWRLDNKDTGRTLEHENTLEANGVEEGHQLSLIRKVVAGAGARGAA